MQGWWLTLPLLFLAACAAGPESDGNEARGDDESVGAAQEGLVWQCPWSQYHGLQYWTCAGGAECPPGSYAQGRSGPTGPLYRFVQGAPQSQACSHGCTQGPLGTNDICAQ